MATVGMGFSIEQDADVQAYKRLRAGILAQERLRRDAAGDARGRELRRLRLSLREDGKQGGVWGGVLRRLGFLCGRGLGRNAVSVGGIVVAAKKLEEDSDFEGEGEDEDEDEGGFVGVEGVEVVEIKVGLKE